jgi:hypothetical protein
MDAWSRAATGAQPPLGRGRHCSCVRITAAPASAPPPPCVCPPPRGLQAATLLSSLSSLTVVARRPKRPSLSHACRSMAASLSPTTGMRMQSKEEKFQCFSQGSRHRDETAPMWVAYWSGIGLKICRRNASGRSEMQSSSSPTHRHTLSASSMIRREWPATGSPWARAGNQMYSEGGRKYTGEEGSNN